MLCIGDAMPMPMFAMISISVTVAIACLALNFELLMRANAIQLARTSGSVMIIPLHSFDARTLLDEQIVKRQQSALGHLLLEAQPVGCEDQVELRFRSDHQIGLVRLRPPINRTELDGHIHIERPSLSLWGRIIRGESHSLHVVE